MYDTIDIKHNNKPTYFAMNQSTKKYLNVGKKINNEYIVNLNEENIIQVKGIIKEDITAYNVTPHIIHKEMTQIVSSKKLIINWGQKEN